VPVRRLQIAVLVDSIGSTRGRQQKVVSRESRAISTIMTIKNPRRFRLEGRQQPIR